MKKKLLILFTIIMTFTLCGCGAKEESNLVELTFDELTKKVDTQISDLKVKYDNAKKIIDYIFKLNDDDLFIFYSLIAFELKRRFKERDDYLNCLK